MSSQYRPSPFTSHPTVVMPDAKSDKPRRVPLYRWVLYAALLLSVISAVWVLVT